MHKEASIKLTPVGSTNGPYKWEVYMTFQRPNSDISIKFGVCGTEEDYHKASKKTAIYRSRLEQNPLGWMTYFTEELKS